VFADLAMQFALEPHQAASTLPHVQLLRPSHQHAAITADDDSISSIIGACIQIEVLQAALGTSNLLPFSSKPNLVFFNVFRKKGPAICIYVCGHRPKITISNIEARVRDQ
jgi:hypothetical protein